MRKTLRLASLVVLVLLTAATTPALAHKMRVFATAQGTTVNGQVYLSGGFRPAEVPVTVQLADDRVVARLKTDRDGTFTFDVQLRADHLIIAESDGHRGTWTIRAAELPAALPAIDGAEAAPKPPAAATATAMADPTMAALVEQAVARQVSPLRAELQAWREEARWRDVAGGLGWIIGLSGLIAWAAARRTR